MADRTCTTPDCDRPVYVKTRGLCRSHYRKWWTARHDRTCTVEGCEKRHEAQGYCPMHYRRWRLYGDALYEAPPREHVVCSIDGCDTEVYGRGWCEKHYARWWRHGGTHDARAIRIDLEDRFWPRVDKAGPINDWRPDLGACWLWIGPPNSAGYGVLNSGGGDGRTIGAHVAAVLIDGRDVHAGMEVDHLCFTTMCVRADHLEVVTHLENVRRSSERQFLTT